MTLRMFAVAQNKLRDLELNQLLHRTCEYFLLFVVIAYFPNNTDLYEFSSFVFVHIFQPYMRKLKADISYLNIHFYLQT